MSDTSQNNKRIAKNTIYLYIRMLLVMAVSLYTSRVILDVLGVEDYGIYNVVGGVVMMFGFVSSSMATSVQRYLTFEIGKEDVDALRKTFSLAFYGHCILAMLFLVVAETVGLWFVNEKLIIPADKMDSALTVFHCVTLVAVVSIMQSPYNAMIFAKEKMAVFAYISILDVVLKLLIVYMLLVGDIDKLKLYGYLTLAVHLIVSGTFYMYVKSQFPETGIIIVKDWKRLKQLVSFAGWTMFGELAWAFTGQGVNIILNVFFGPAINAARSVAEQVNAAVSRFVQNFQQAVNPQLIKDYASDDLAAMKKLLYRGTKLSIFLQLLFSVPLFIEMDYILSLWLKEVPAYTADFCRLMLLSALVQGFSNLFATVARAYGRIRKYQMVVSFFLFLNFPFSYLLLWLGLSPVSTMYVNIAVSASLLLVRICLVRAMIALPAQEYTVSVVVPCSVVCLCVFLSTSYIMSFFTPSLPRLFATGALSVLTLTVFVWLFGLNSEERQWVQHLAINKFRHSK